MTDSKRENWWNAAEFFLLLFEITLCSIIILNVPYTEIDWQAYMQQVEMWMIDDQRDYSQIYGRTGPLVYPAGFLYLFSILWWLTDHGRDIRRAQWVYMALQVTSVWLAARIYRNSLKKSALIFMLPALALSRRLHSILLLRLFNDPWASILLLACCLAMQRRQFKLACLLYTLALSIKMNSLLWLPGVGMLMVQALGWRQAIWLISSLVVGPQIALAWPFLRHNPTAYFTRAFDFGRQFLYQWTVNWRMLPEFVFLGRWWSVLLLLLHAYFLLMFAHRRWLREWGGLWEFILHPTIIAKKVANQWPMRVPTVLFTCQLVGVTFARSLHYQFYSWYYLTLPFLVWQAFGGRKSYSVLALIEISWNVFPATWWSSSLMLAMHALILLGLWRNDKVKLK